MSARARPSAAARPAGGNGRLILLLVLGGLLIGSALLGPRLLYPDPGDPFADLQGRTGPAPPPARPGAPAPALATDRSSEALDGSTGPHATVDDGPLPLRNPFAPADGTG